MFEVCSLSFFQVQFKHFDQREFQGSFCLKISQNVLSLFANMAICLQDSVMTNGRVQRVLVF